MNGIAYEFEKDTFNLILFADAATYNKSGNRSMWALFSSFVELPPALRHFLHGIFFHRKKYFIKIHLFIADAPARAKGCVSTQFNGKFGCIKCLHPTINIDHVTLYPNIEALNTLLLTKIMKVEVESLKITANQNIKFFVQQNFSKKASSLVGLINPSIININDLDPNESYSL